jgi:hypothetical protein
MNLSTIKQALLFGALPLLLIIAFEHLYKNSMFESTLNDVPKMQLKKRMAGFFTIFSSLGESHLPIIILITLFNLTNKMKALSLWFSFGFLCYLNSGILKSLYSDPRPFWVSL